MTKLVGWTIDDEDEVFVPAPDYPTLFEVGSKGSLRSLRTGKLLSQTPDDKGYLRHATKVGGRQGKDICVRVHVQVAKAFVPRESDDLEVNHTTGDKSINDYTHLEWTTRQENMDHASETGLLGNTRGEDHGLSILTQAQADEIRELKGKHSQREIARQYGISRGVVYQIHAGLRYNV